MLIHKIIVVIPIVPIIKQAFIYMGIKFLIGSSLVALGIFFLWITQKYPAKGIDPFAQKYRGIFGGGGCILFGLWLLWQAFQKH